VEKPNLILYKKADKVLNRIVLPKKFIDEYGYEYSMEVYEDKIVLIPIRRGK
jgi:hypothetical protein